MPDKFAYRASDELAAALRAHEQECVQWDETVMKPWDDVHPDTVSMWTRSMFGNVQLLGFADPGGDVPAGLSRARDREWLVPARGRAGDPWRAAAATLDARPKLTAVFAALGVETTFLMVDHGRRYTMGLIATPDAVYLTWGCEHPNPGKHLTPVKLSEYYAAREALEESGSKPEGQQ